MMIPMQSSYSFHADLKYTAMFTYLGESMG